MEINKRQFLSFDAENVTAIQKHDFENIFYLGEQNGKLTRCNIDTNGLLENINK